MSVRGGDGSDDDIRPGTGEENGGGGYSATYVYLLAAVAALGGMLWGYDTGVIAGAQGFLKQTFQFGPTTPADRPPWPLEPSSARSLAAGGPCLASRRYLR